MAKYKYTSKDHSAVAIMSCVFGVLSIVTFYFCIYLSFKVAGEGVARYGTSALLAIVFMLVGFGLGIYSLFELNKFRIFSVIGIILNAVGFFMLSGILYAGAMFFE